MSRIRPSLALGSVIVVGLSLWAAAQMDPGGASMAEAAERFLAALDEPARAKAVFGFDDPERLNWHFIPRQRKGLSIKEMTPAQRALAFGLIQSGTSRSGAIKATTIMSLEAILRDLERGSGPVRDPELYYVSVFGTPSTKGRWGWRVEGHHLSLNFTIEDGKIVSATPAFFGANPAEVRQGPRQGLRTLAEIEDRALRLFQSLDESQQKRALASDRAPADIPSNTGNPNGLDPAPPALEPVGLPVTEMKPGQRRLLESLIDAYAGDMPPEVASAWRADVERSGDEIRFAWFGPADRTQPHAYLIQGQTFLIEFNNTQNNANHIHSSYRSRVGDFGRPLVQ
ncbi:MAG: hypothetical protein KatS3mg108_0597 [Isosphaeraceae bacterium]|jgi:hypothetical protein|nr:MAG: hypothetical protein KatS3mg108_0597 [Isosphaeraceae bacterium]